MMKCPTLESEEECPSEEEEQGGREGHPLENRCMAERKSVRRGG